eukprot:4608-Heterococcus_DN1.PRE.1
MALRLQCASVNSALGDTSRLLLLHNTINNIAVLGCCSVLTEAPTIADLTGATVIVVKGVL